MLAQRWVTVCYAGAALNHPMSYGIRLNDRCARRMASGSEISRAKKPDHRPT